MLGNYCLGFFQRPLPISLKMLGQGFEHNRLIVSRWSAAILGLLPRYSSDQFIPIQTDSMDSTGFSA
jgi:hypothetical protein